MSLHSLPHVLDVHRSRLRFAGTPAKWDYDGLLIGQRGAHAAVAGDNLVSDTLGACTYTGKKVFGARLNVLLPNGRRAHY